MLECQNEHFKDFKNQIHLLLRPSTPVEPTKVFLFVCLFSLLSFTKLKLVNKNLPSERECINWWS